MNKLKRKNGITLIALIITIVVLLILAVVTIRAVSDGGIIWHGKTASEEHKLAQEEEEIRLAFDEWKVQKNTPEYEGNFESFMTQKLSGNNTLVASVEKVDDNLVITMGSGRVYTVTEAGAITLQETTDGGEVVTPPASGGDDVVTPPAEGNEPEVSEPTEAGLYSVDGTFTSWDDLVKNRKIRMKDNTIASCRSEIQGRLVIPNNITSITDYTFSTCAGLTSVIIPDSVTSIGERAFEGCSSLTSVTIPGNVTSIEDFTFWGCSGLTSITIPNSVTSIGSQAFDGCSSLTSIIIPNSVTSIGDYAFAECSSLASVTLPDNGISIGEAAFLECSSLTSITIPDSATYIENYSIISNCYNLKSITWKGTTYTDVYSFLEAFKNK